MSPSTPSAVKPIDRASRRRSAGAATVLSAAGVVLFRWAWAKAASTSSQACRVAESLQMASAGALNQ